MKTIAKQTHIAKARLQDLTVNEQIQKILNWSNDQFCNHQYEQYEAFIARESYQHPVIMQEIRYSEIFRSFWNNEWILRNLKEFLPFAESHEPGEADIIDEYLYINNHKKLINDPFFIDKYENILKTILKYEL